MILRSVESYDYIIPYNKSVKIPELFISDEYLTDVIVKLHMIDQYGTNNKIIYTEDHPTFTANRNWLAKNNYICKQTNLVNGDKVLKDFILNKVKFSVGDTFPCAAAIKNRLKTKGKQ